jgi:hypothetical protein
MRKSTLYGIAIVVIAAALGSAVIATDAVAAGGNAFSHEGGAPFGGAITGGRFGGGFGAGRFEHGHYGSRGLAVPFEYYGDYGAYRRWHSSAFGKTHSV